MSFIGGGMGGAAGPAGGMRFAQTRGRIQGSAQGVNYPSPFFDIAHTYLPVTIKNLLKWCRYYFLTNPLINATVFKLSEYPVTDIFIEHSSEQVKQQWSEYLQDTLRYRSFQIEVGLDYHAYGNAFISVGYPFKKYLYCKACGFRDKAEKIRGSWVFTNYQFRLTCPECATVGDAIAKDFYFKNASGIKLIRWNPEDIEITYNDVSGEYTYFYTIPPTVRNDIVVGRKDIVEGIPQVFIQALREAKGVVFSKDNFFHLKRPTLANQDRGWGIPLLLPVLKDTFYLQIMKKAQEAILVEHIVPLRVLFPQAGSGASDPYTTINLVDWRDHVAAEIARWRYDNNYIPIMPLPLGNQTIGGDGKSLLLTGEIQQWSQQIMVGMGVPQEFLLGGMSYAGTNVSMRMLENAFLGYILRHKQLLRFVIKNVAAFMGWPEVKTRFKPFKMADDLQRKALMFQMNQAQKVSDTTMLADSDLDAYEENQLMIKEVEGRMEAMKKVQLATAQIQGEAQLVMTKYQVKSQQAMMQAQAAPAAPGEAGGPDQVDGGTPGGQAAEGGASQLPPEMQVQPPQVQGPDGMPIQAQTPPPPSGFLPQVSSQLGMGQKMPQDANGQPTGMNIDMPSMAMAQAQQISMMPPMAQKAAVDNLRGQSPEFADLVLQMLTSLQGQQGQQAISNSGTPQAGQVDARPQPVQKPARRSSAGV
jgi:hypothetical protein